MKSKAKCEDESDYKRADTAFYEPNLFIRTDDCNAPPASKVHIFPPVSSAPVSAPHTDIQYLIIFELLIISTLVTERPRAEPESEADSSILTRLERYRRRSGQPLQSPYTVLL